MKIAVCLSGQPRTWRKCIPAWSNLFSSFKDAQIDYFCHLWNFNTLPQLLAKPENEYAVVSQEELDELCSLIIPKKYMIEDHAKNLKVRNDILAIGERNPERGGTPVHWAGSQFYSHMRSVHLKRQYEIENNFEYDICIRMRSDLMFNQTPFLSNIRTLTPNTIYSCHSGVDGGQGFRYRIGDLFFFSDSITFDKLAEFYRFLPIIGNLSFKDPCPPEIPFAFYIKMLNIQNHSTTFDPKVVRTTEYAILKNEMGLGELQGYELI